MEEKGEEKPKRAGRIALIVFIALYLFVFALYCVIDLGMSFAHLWTPWRPDYARVDITAILEKTELTDEDYETLQLQTGLTRLGVDGILAAGDEERILDLQEHYFADYEVTDYMFAPFLCREVIPVNIPLAELEDGDILVSPTAHFSGFRFGHAVMVLGGDTGTIIASEGYGRKSGLFSLAAFTNRPSFVVLRHKDRELAEKVARYAESELLGIDYSLTVGVIEPKNPDTLTRTQCAHIIWYAYNHFGVDLDASGGVVVSPMDLATSPELELVQSYGIEPGKRWR